MKAIIIYTPALHKGYIDFFRENLDSQIFLLDLSLIRKIPRMERDIRAVEAVDIKNALQGIGISNVQVMKEETVKEVLDAKQIIIPEDSALDEFINKYLKDSKKIKRVSIFLRWDKHRSCKTSLVNEDRKVSKKALDKEFMNKALLQSQKSTDWWRQVGAVLVKSNKVILAGFNHPLPTCDIHNIFGDPRINFDYGESFEISKFIHAEADIVARAAKKGVNINNSHLYVTTFPCPVCAKLVAVAGVKKVYFKEGYSRLDAEDILKSFDIEIIRVV